MMKRFLSITLSAVIAMIGLASCETYVVEEPDMTAVSKVDGAYICFAYENGSSDPSTVLHVQITNTTDDESDRIWFTITDCANVDWDYYALDAIRFDAKYDASTNSFSASNVTCTEPRTCYSWLYEQSYYTIGYRRGYQNYVVNVDGKVTVDGVNTLSGYKSDAIEFNYSRQYPDGSVKNYTVKGMKNTGWGEDLVEYAAWMDENV